MSIEIKICGITSREDALAAVESGADAIGFIFHPPSPRYVTPETAAEIVEAVAGAAATVGVFVNADIQTVMDTMAECSLDLIQLHGSEPPDYCRRFPPHRIIKAITPRANYDPAGLDGYDVRTFLLDTYDPKHHGGTGRQADWAAAAMIAKKYPLILAGGLTRDNILDGIDAVSPHAVDINSGVELYPGKKDREKIEHIIRMVRQHDTAGGSRNIFCRHTKTEGENDEATITG